MSFCPKDNDDDDDVDDDDAALGAPDLLHSQYFIKRQSLPFAVEQSQVWIIWLRLVSDVVPYLIFNISMHHDRCWSGTKWQGRKKEELLVYER